MKDCGIILISFGYDYQNITSFCVSSIRQFTDLPILIHVNTPLHILNKDINNFKNIELIYHNLNDDDNRILKTNLINYTKFKKTMYLDVDSIVLSSEFLKEFDELNNFDIISPFWKEYSINELEKVINTHKKFEKFIKALNENAIQKTKKHTLIGGGICYFNNNKNVSSFFEDYKNKYIEYNIPQDMPSLNYSYIKNKNRFKILDNKLYNNTDSKIIKSLHSSLLKDENLINSNFSRRRSDPITNEIKFVKQGTDELYIKPKLCLIYDIEGWAFFHMSNYLKKYLNNFYEIDIIKFDAKLKKKYDIIFLFSYAIDKNKELDYKKICAVSSHKKEINELNLEKYKYILLNDINLFKKLNHKNKFYIPNGVDINFYNGTKRNITKNKKINIGAIGSLALAEWKGKERINYICEKLNKIGYNVENSSLYVDVKKNKLNQQEMFNYYKEIDIFIISSFSETGPNTLLEAMSMGIPVISNKVGLAPDLIENYKTGFLIDNYEDIDKYVNYIIELIESPKLYSDISENSMNKIKKYDWSIIAMKYKNMFDNFLEGKNQINESYIFKKNENKKKYLKKDKIVFSLNSSQKNMKNLEFIVPNILRQCDFLYINTINYNLSKNKYAFLNDDKIIINKFSKNNFETLFSHFNNHGDEVYYFPISDELKYPYDYSYVMIKEMNNYNNEYICSGSGYDEFGNFYDVFQKNDKELENFIPNIITSCFFVKNFEVNKDILQKLDLIHQYDFFPNDNSVKSVLIKKIKYWLKYF
jgi:glycosyltransferase involved in cell wall biosynthesis